MLKDQTVTALKGEDKSGSQSFLTTCCNRVQCREVSCDLQNYSSCPRTAQPLIKRTHYMERKTRRERKRGEEKGKGSCGKDMQPIWRARFKLRNLSGRKKWECGRKAHCVSINCIHGKVKVGAHLLTGQAVIWENNEIKEQKWGEGGQRREKDEKRMGWERVGH